MNTQMPWRAQEFAPLTPEKERAWSKYTRWERVYFPTYIGLSIEELRTGYARLRLRFKPELEQAAGFVHGGAIASLIDTCAVPAVGTYYDEHLDSLTLSFTVNYLKAVAGQDAIGEAWVEQGGRSVAFCRAEVRTEDGEPVANASLVFRVLPKSR
ncbi:MAG: PaaI family thioesterase [Acidimicrobiales bacterium]